MDTDTSHYKVTATPWSSGWELTLDDDNITSTRRLSDAHQQVRDYLDTIQPNVDHSHAHIEIHPDLGGIEIDIDKAKNEGKAAAKHQEEAAKSIRRVVLQLKVKGVSSHDSAELLGISRGRIYQLLRDSKKLAAQSEEDHQTHTPI